MVDAPRDHDGAAGTPASGETASADSREHTPIDTALDEGLSRLDRSSGASLTDRSDDASQMDPRRAYEVLEIRTPLEEFEGYVRARIDTLSRLGESDKAELASKALEVGRRALARVTGTTAIPSPQERAQ